MVIGFTLALVVNLLIKGSGSIFAPRFWTILSEFYPTWWWKSPEIIYKVKEIYDQQYVVVGEVTGEYLVDLILELQEIGFEQ
jgi:hypothetical protein